jgi:Methyltransferase domain
MPYRSFFTKPYGVGAPPNIYMFTPASLARHIKTLVCDPRYFLARVRVAIFQLLHPGYPWLTAWSIKTIEAYLDKSMVALEWGSGLSTVWLARRTGRLTSVEHDAVWYSRISERLRMEKIANVDYRRLATDPPANSPYVSVADEFADDSLDFILVDGELRNHCLEVAVTKLKPGGILVLDNADKNYWAPALVRLKRRQTDNGVWRTDLFTKPIAT